MRSLVDSLETKTFRAIREGRGLSPADCELVLDLVEIYRETAELLEDAEAELKEYWEIEWQA